MKTPMHALLMILFCCGLASAFGSAWPTYHGSADLQGFAETSLPDSLQRTWIYNTNGRIETTPVSDGQRIFAAAGKGRIIALSPDGIKVWETTFSRTNDAGATIPLRFDAPLLCHQGLVLAGSSRGILLALDGMNGTERWRVDLGGILLGSPNIIDENHIVVLDQGDGALHCIAVQTGKVVWTTEGVERCDGSPGVGNGTVAFGSCLAALHVYDAGHGKHLRDIEVGSDGQIAGGVAVSGNRAYFGTRDGRLICANLDLGIVAWTSDESKDQTFSTPALGGDRIVYSSDNGWVYAVDRTMGRTIWEYDTGGLPGSAVIAGDKVLLAVDGQLLMLKLVDGALCWKQSISDALTSPALIGDSVVVGADDGTISAWGSAPARKENE